MKKLLTLSAFLCLCLNLQAQCIANAGPDYTFCPYNVTDSLVLGGSPTVTGGLAPYKYLWSTDTSLTETEFPASFYLDDTTKANPILRHTDNIILFLMVSDSLGNACYDTMKVYVSKFDYTSTGTSYFLITSGDSIQLDGGISGALPVKFYWSPLYNMTDSTDENPIVFPTTRTVYSHWIMDSVGCYSDTLRFDVNVAGVSVTKVKSENQVSVYPHPLNIHSVLEFDAEAGRTYSVMVFNSSGQLVKLLTNTMGSVNIGAEITEPGIYFYRILNDSQEVEYTGKLLK